MINNFDINYTRYKEETENFNKKYRDSVSHKIKLFLGFNKKELALYKQRLSDLCEETSNNYSLRILKEKFNSLSNESPLYEKYLKKVIKISFKTIDKREDSVGFTWKITNKETGIVHYVVGTSHAATKNMIKNPSIKEAVANTKLLITELKGSRILIWMRELERWMTGSTAKYAVDDELIKWAWKQKSKTHGIETFSQQVKLTTRPMHTFLADIFLIVKRVIFDSRINNYLAVQFWQDGEEDKIPLTDVPNSLLKDRNVRWLNEISFKDNEGKKFQGLIELLKKTNTPTCVAVGAAHCVGDNATQGIIYVLQEQGFEIERL